LNRSYTTHY